MRLSEVLDIRPDLHLIYDEVFLELGLSATLNTSPTLGFLEDSKYCDQLLNNSSISCAIVTKDIADYILSKKKIGLLISDNPKYEFFMLHNYLVESTEFYSEIFENVISKSAKIHPTAWIAEHNVTIGENTIIGPNVVIYPNTTIGNEVSIGANTVIGGEGFECFRYNDTLISVKHAGGVVIKNNAEIHANTCIDKGLFRNNTVIGEFARIDNLIHIAHNVNIGKRSYVVAGAMVAGRVVVGDDVWIGPSASIRNGCTISNNGFVSMGSVVTKDVEPGQTVSGNFAIEHSKFIAFMKSINK